MNDKLIEKKITAGNILKMKTRKNHKYQIIFQ